MRKTRSFSGSFILHFVLVMALFGTLSCSKEEPKSKAAAPQPAQNQVARQTAPLDLSKSLLELVPKDTLGFLVFEAKHPAYLRYKSSPWASGSGWTTMLQSAGPEVKQAADMLKRLGFDLEDKNTFDKVLSECALFVAPPVAGEGKPAAGIVFRPQTDFKLGEFVANLKKEVSAQGQAVKVEDVTIAGAPGVRFEDTSDGGVQANPLKEFFVAQKQNVGVVATSKQTAENVLSAQGGSLPDIVSAPNFVRSSSGLPANESRFATLYLDIEKFAGLADRFGNAELANKAKSEPLPVKAVAMAMAMGDAPSTDVRLIYDDSTPQNKEWLSTLASSPSSAVIAAMPAKPLFFISLDGQTIRRAKEKIVATMGPQAEPFKAQLAVLDGIGRLGIAAKSAPPGQSMLPIPDLLIVAEAKQPAKVQGAVEQLLGPLVSSSVPGMQWKSIDINGVQVRAMQSPMGVGAFIAGSNGLVVLASTEAEMKGMLANVSGKGTGFATALSSNAAQVLAKEPSVGNLYVNFDEVASALESLGGMIAMFAPQGQDSAQQFLSPENIQALRKMGTVVGAVTLDAGAINIRSFYQGSAV